MSEINYKEKYLKYKTKYLELKKGGGSKKLTFKQINNKFEELKKNNIPLYFKRNSKEKLEITKIYEDISNKGNKYLSIWFKDISKESKNYGEEYFEQVHNYNMIQYFEATYNLEIKKIGDDYFLRYCIGDCTGIVN
jgi:hypothetical protein